MSKEQQILDWAIGVMQRCSSNLFTLCQELLPPNKVLTSEDVIHLRKAIEVLADHLDKDSLLFQEALDKSNKIEDVADISVEPSDVSLPKSPPKYTEDCMSREEHIEKFWGIDYDSDNMPSFG